MSELIIHNEPQGSDEWRALRRSKRTASETPMLMGTSRWSDAADVYDSKLGAVKEDNFITAHGRTNEEPARLAAVRALGVDGAPMVGSRGDYLASLDFIGADEFGQTIVVDIKCPYQKEKSETWKAAKKNTIEPAYMDQLEHQYRVFRPDVIGLFVWISDDKHVFIRYRPNDERWEQIQRRWDSFVKDSLEPQVRPSEFTVRTDKEWLMAAQKWAGVKAKLDEAEKEEAAARAALIELSNGQKCEGAGVRVNRVVSRGSVDYKLALQSVAPDLDVEPFRKEPSEKFVVTQPKEKK